MPPFFFSSFYHFFSLFITFYHFLSYLHIFYHFSGYHLCIQNPSKTNPSKSGYQHRCPEFRNHKDTAFQTCANASRTTTRKLKLKTSCHPVGHGARVEKDFFVNGGLYFMTYYFRKDTKLPMMRMLLVRTTVYRYVPVKPMICIKPSMKTCGVQVCTEAVHSVAL